jgi:hypothetical protein
VSLRGRLQASLRVRYERVKGHAAPLLGCIRMFTGRQPLALVVEGTGDSKHPAWALALPGMLPGHTVCATALLLATADKLGRTRTHEPAFSGLTGSGHGGRPGWADQVDHLEDPVMDRRDVAWLLNA